MPAKRRSPKRRTGDAAELAAWAGTFDCGVDFGDDLAPLGLHGDADFGAPEREDVIPLPWAQDRYRRNAEVYAAAREAWGRLGAAFMAAWAPLEPDKQPWALEAFGAPRGHHAA